MEDQCTGLHKNKNLKQKIRQISIDIFSNQPYWFWYKMIQRYKKSQKQGDDDDDDND